MRKFFLIFLFSTAASASIFLNSFNSGQLSKDLKQRHDLDRTSMGSETLENILVWPQGMAAKRPGTEYIDSVYGKYTAAVAGTASIPATYRYTYINENGGVWGIPFDDEAAVCLDAGPAVDIGGGTVGLPYDNAAEDGTMRFIAGDIVTISGTTNYSAVSYTLTSGTTNTQLQFTGVYVAETFDGTETVVKYISNIAGAGRMAKDSNDNIYIGHGWDATNGLITRIATNGTQTSSLTFLNTTWPYAKFSSPMVTGLCVDDSYLYLLIFQSSPGWGWIEKYELSSGDLVWSVESTGAGYQLAIDADGNAYCSMAGYLKKFASADGTATTLTGGYSRGSYVCLVDDDLGIVVGTGGPLNAWEDGYGYNVWARKLDDSDGDMILLGDYSSAIGTGNFIIYDSFIYALAYSAAGGFTLNKLQWDGSSLSIVSSVAGRTYQVGLFADLYGNIVMVCQDWDVAQTTIFYYYDTDLAYLGTNIGNLSGTMLRTWDSPAGGAWIQGDVANIGALGTPGGAGTPATWSYIDTYPEAIEAVRLIPFEYSTNDAYVLEFGHKYIGFLRTTQ